MQDVESGQAKWWGSRPLLISRPDRSLSRLARKRYQRDVGRRPLWPRLHARFWATVHRVWFLPIGIPAVVWATHVYDTTNLPPILPGVPRGLGDDVLSTLLGAHATVMALVTTVVLFAFEGLGRLRPLTSSLEYVRRARLLPYLHLGVGALLGTGMVVVFDWNRSPRTAAAVALVSTGISFALLPLLVRMSVSVMTSGWLTEQRVAEVSDIIGALVEREAAARTAMSVFTEEIGESPTGPAHPQHLVIERAAADGVFRDVDLADLRTAVESELLTNVQLAIGLGTWVRQGTPLLMYWTSTPDAETDGPYTTIRPQARDDLLGDLLERLREEADLAITARSTVSFDRVLSAHRELWLAWPRAWHHLGTDPEGVTMPASQLFRPVSGLQTDMLDLARRTVEEGSPSFRDAIVANASTISRVAIRLRASDVLARMLEVLLAIAAEQPEAPSSFERLAQVYDELVTHTLASIVNADGWDPQLTRCANAVARSTAEAIRRGAATGDTGVLNRLLGVIDDLADQEQLPPSDEGVVEDQAAALRLELAGWLLDHPEIADTETWTHLVKELMNRLGGPNGVSDHLITALDSHLTDRWTIGASPGTVVHIDSEGPLLRVLALTLLRSVATPHLTPADWMNAHRVSRIVQIIGDISEDGHLLDRLDIGVAPDKVAAATEAVRTAATAHTAATHAQIAAEPIQPHFVELVETAVADTFCEHRDLYHLLSAAGANPTPHAGPWGPEDQVQLTVPVPRTFLTGSDTWTTSETGTLGRAFSQTQAAKLLRTLLKDAMEAPPASGPTEELQGAIEDLRTNGYTPTVILVPIDHELIYQLGVTPPPPNGPNLGEWHRGYFGSIPVFDWPTWPHDTIVVTDLDAALTVLDPPIGGPRTLSLNVENVPPAESGSDASETSTVPQILLSFRRPTRIVDRHPEASRRLILH